MQKIEIKIWEVDLKIKFYIVKTLHQKYLGHIIKMKKNVVRFVCNLKKGVAMGIIR